MLRIYLYGMAIPGLLALAALAAIVLPGDGDDLTLTRLLVGCTTMIVVQVSGGFIGGRLAGRRM